MSVALLDGDAIAYRASVTAQSDIDWGDGGEGPSVSYTAAIENALATAQAWTELAGCESAILCMSPRDGGNFRRSLCNLYKQERPAKPLAYWEVVDALEDAYETMRIPDLEADDVMGLLATHPTEGQRRVIVSIDKDMRTVPARLVNPLKTARPRRTPNFDADHFWMMQTLTGDRVDGYRGCPGIGEKKATRILAEATALSEMWRAVVAAYEVADLTHEDALRNARLARILRHGDYDMSTGKVRLWRP